MRIIPAIDVIDGKCVRLTQGDYDRKNIYHENPVEVALQFQDNGLKHLHLVDLDGAKAGKVTNWKVAEAITRQTNLVVDFGGGIKTADEIQKLLDLGVRQVNLGSIAVKAPQLVREWIHQFGPETIILSADVKNNIVAISGWQESASLQLHDFVSDYMNAGVNYVTCTDIATDGMLSGPNVQLYQRLIEEFPSIKLIASGGVSSLKDLDDLLAVNVDGVIIGKAIYEGRIQLNELSDYAQ